MKDFNLSIYKSMLTLERSSPDLFFLLRKTKVITDKFCPTAYASINKEGFKIVINEKWAETLDNFSLSALIEHEILHVLFGHLTDYSILMPNKRLANVAMDLIINEAGNLISQKDRLDEKLKAGCFLSDFNEKFKTDFSSYRNTSLEIYNFLTEKSDSDKNGLESFDEGLTDETQEGQADSKIQADNKGQAKIEDFLSPDEINQVLKSYGSKSAELKLVIEKREKLAKNKRVKKALESFLTSNKNDFKKSSKRLNKRFSFMPYGREKDKNQKILIALDLSGSMLSPEIIEKMKIAVSSSIGYGFSVDLIFGDTKKLGGFKDLKKSFDFSQLKGGGGTELDFIFQEKLSLYDGLIVFTDGYFDHKIIPKKLANKMIFLMTNKDKIDGFKTIEMI